MLLASLPISPPHLPQPSPFMGYLGTLIFQGEVEEGRGGDKKLLTVHLPWVSALHRSSPFGSPLYRVGGQMDTKTQRELVTCRRSHRHLLQLQE